MDRWLLYGVQFMTCSIQSNLVPHCLTTTKCRNKLRHKTFHDKPYLYIHDTFNILLVAHNIVYLCRSTSRRRHSITPKSKVGALAFSLSILHPAWFFFCLWCFRSHLQCFLQTLSLKSCLDVIFINKFSFWKIFVMLWLFSFFRCHIWKMTLSIIFK